MMGIGYSTRHTHILTCLQSNLLQVLPHVPFPTPLAANWSHFAHTQSENWVHSLLCSGPAV